MVVTGGSVVEDCKLIVVSRSDTNAPVLSCDVQSKFLWLSVCQHIMTRVRTIVQKIRLSDSR
jgi:hypothetical protein